MSARFIRVLLCAVIAAGAVSGCVNPEKKKKEAAKAKKAEEDKHKPKIPDMSTDMQFQSFIGRLRAAVARHDRATISALMNTDFGYRWDPAMAGETCFDYWDEHNTWPELARILNERFQPSGVYMVAPPQFVSEESYTGFRAGMQVVNGGWRFAYFIGGQDPLP